MIAATAGDDPCIVRDQAENADERIALFVDALGATAQISFMRPFAGARKEGRAAFAVITEAAFDALDAAAADSFLYSLWLGLRPTVCVISRQASRNIPAIVRRCELSGTRLVMHLDDDLFAVPADLGAGKTARHSAPERLGRLTIAARRANLIYASTAPLAQRLSARFPDRKIISGELYCSADAPFQPYRADAPPVFGYMGTKGHAADLDLISPAIAAILEADSEAQFEVFGTIKPPAALARFADRVRHRTAFGEYADFLDAMKVLGWRVGLAPLKDSPFNRCKADTKFVEYTQAGIPSLCASASGVYARAIDARARLGRTINPSGHRLYSACCTGRIRARAGRSRAEVLAEAYRLTFPCAASRYLCRLTVSRNFSDYAARMPLRHSRNDGAFNEIATGRVSPDAEMYLGRKESP